MKRVLFVSLAGVLFVLTACAAPQSTPRPASQDVFDRTRASMDRLRTCRSESTTTEIEDGRTTATSQLIEYVGHDRIRVVTTFRGVTSEEMLIGDAVYYRDSAGGLWTSRQLPQPGVTWSSRQITRGDWTAGFRSLLGLVQLGDQKIDGVDCYHYRGQYDIEAAIEEAIAAFPTADPSDPRCEDLLRQRELMAASLSSRTSFMEFWIGKDDYLVRRIQIDGSGAKFEISNGATTATPLASTTVNRYFDFNSDIKIETPANVETVNLAATLTSAGPGDDSSHFRPSWTVTVLNMGIEAAQNVRVFVDTSATNLGYQTIEAVPNSSPVAILPGGSANFTAAWQVDSATMEKKTFIELLTLATVRATWTRLDGTQGQRALLKGGLPVIP